MTNPTEEQEGVTQKLSEAQSEISEPNLVETIIVRANLLDSGLIMLQHLSNHRSKEILELNNIMEQQEYDIQEDFDWFTSGQVETDSFKGQHIAIWKKQIIGSGETPLEAERIAKAYYGNDCRPAVVYIPKDEEIDTIF